MSDSSSFPRIAKKISSQEISRPKSKGLNPDWIKDIESAVHSNEVNSNSFLHVTFIFIYNLSY